jgi:hypothetical protein
MRIAASVEPVGVGRFGDPDFSDVGLQAGVS